MHMVGEALWWFLAMVVSWQWQLVVVSINGCLFGFGREADVNVLFGCLSCLTRGSLFKRAYQLILFRLIFHKLKFISLFWDLMGLYDFIILSLYKPTKSPNKYKPKQNNLISPQISLNKHPLGLRLVITLLMLQFFKTFG